MRKKLLLIVGFIGVLLVGGLSTQRGKSLFSLPKTNQQEVDDTLIESFKKAAEQINATTPIMVDDDTRMDQATVGPGALVTYHYTFPNYSSRDITPIWITDTLRSVVKNNVCGSKEMKPSLQYGGAYAFSYSGSDGIAIASFHLDRNDCGFPSLTP